ncbi:AbrB/MazE/SpoVT family DNA-binding domain-containing protein [Romboutsia sp.]|uniref:AbrB/MazE/SpoVT family DNA-binding domain-containing protein n=1 Tax=Romboutsia sp. TaxID=1965302 RepID=UPI002BA43881|nr:AbrB/MazE/SpoVT family DNA-binding domain-containing protein [Romboutsia sp.]HSQ90174.1 AbrB/MazE/SpoVT family DNA-binding domain-containing protein [Romboutsia sp.]
MKFRGIIRKLDELGRIVMPKEYRKEINAENGAEVEMTLYEDGIIIKKAHEGTLITRKIDNLGRLVISKKIRKVLEIEECGELEMFLLVEDAIYVRKVVRNEGL